jgi:hypothetical protein
MRLKSRIVIAGGLVSLLVLFVSLVSLPLAGNVWATATMFPDENTFEFTNNEGEDAYDLHIHWSRAVKVEEVKPFKKKGGKGASNTDFSNGVVKPTEKASVKVSWDGSTEAKVEEWWWTKKDGKQLGEKKTGNPTSASTSTRPNGAAKASVVTANGLHRIAFDTLQGQVIISLPDDVRAGDTISGTVVTKPKGNTDDERNANAPKLSELKLNLGSKFPQDKKELLIFITPRVIIEPEDEPGTQSPNRTPFSAKLPESFDYTIGVSAPRTDASTVTINISRPIWFVNDQATTPGTEPPASARLFSLPSMGQQGRPVEIFGPFDGNASNTTLNFVPDSTNVSGGSGLYKDSPLAESPRKAVFECPTNATGPMEITLKEGNIETKGQYRNVGVNLSAPKTNLLKGESTTLTVKFSVGAPPPTEPVPATVKAEGVITMQGGNYQQFTINQDSTITLGITGNETGAWSATATIVTQPFNIVLRDPTPPQTILVNSFNGNYVYCGSGFKLSGTGTIKRAGCVLTLTDNRPDRRVQGTLDSCVPVDNGKFSVFYAAGTNTDVKVTVTDEQPPRRRIYFNPLNRPMPPVQDVSAFATCP